ncbi:hypothetical protein BDR04DRAFT_1128584 [Suillus decipiens]|nr:hypothetical protein BDR04DRAFT_1128584 [Suillus decipiens]
MNKAGEVSGNAKTTFETIRDDQVLRGSEIWGPFADEDEWHLAKWLIKNVSHNQADEFLKLNVVQRRVQPSFHNKNALLSAIDELPSRIDWQCEAMTLTGDITNDEDPVECIRELIGNPCFKESMYYTPEHSYTVIDEMWTADWWWNMQECVPVGLTIAPTQLSQFCGDKAAWPVYLTIGNISKDVRYLPVGHFDGFSDKARPLAKYCLFHACLKQILATMASAGQIGKDMTCGDGAIRHVWPILAAYVADYPEQCLTITMLAQNENAPSPELTKEIKNLGLQPIFPPFWATLPHTDIFQAFTPDLLHQLHKGVFKDHLVQWTTCIMGENEVDEQFKSMTSHHGLRHFKNGISSVSQWTGKEHKEMEKVFIGLISGGVNLCVIRTVCAVTDFIYYSSLQSHTDHSLQALTHALKEFHAHKDVFIEMGGRKATHFNIPKIHSMQHYEAYCAGNKKDYIAQMTVWLRCQEAVDRFSTYLDWYKDDEIVIESSPLDVAESEHSAATPFLHGSITHIPTTHPPHLRRVPAHKIISDQHASQFLQALSTYIHTLGILYVPKSFDTFDLFSCLAFELPAIAEVSSHKLKNIVHVSPPIACIGRRLARPACLDFAFVHTVEANACTDGTCLQGPLAYIEWMTPLQEPDPDLGMFVVSQSTRRHQQHAEIIPFGCTRDPSWTAENVNIMCDQFYVNPYIDMHMFCLLKLQRKNSV